MHIDNIEAAKKHIDKLLGAEDLDRAELAEFINEIYSRAVEMWPAWRYAYREKTMRHFRDVTKEQESNAAARGEPWPSSSFEPEKTDTEVLKEIFKLLMPTALPRLSAPVPEGTIEACDETLQNEKENLWVVKHGNPFKYLGTLDLSNVDQIQGKE